MKFLNIIRTFILGLLLLTAAVTNAQQSKMESAFKFYEQNNLESAKADINAAISNPETAKDAQAWQIRGYIYKSIYKNEKSNKQSPARLEALKSIKKSEGFDTKKEYLQLNINAAQYLISTLSNDAVEFLDPVDYEKAIELEKKIIEYYPLMDSSITNQQKQEIAFDENLGTVYSSILDKSPENTKFVNLAKGIYERILTLDPDNITANLNMGLLYFNRGVNLIISSDMEMDITKLEPMQEKSVKLFKESLPFMERAYDINPNKIVVLQGLKGIFHALHDEEKFNFYQKKIEEINKQK